MRLKLGVFECPSHDFLNSRGGDILRLHRGDGPAQLHRSDCWTPNNQIASKPNYQMVQNTKRHGGKAFIYKKEE